MLGSIDPRTSFDLETPRVDAALSDPSELNGHHVLGTPDPKNALPKRSSSKATSCGSESDALIAKSVRPEGCELMAGFHSTVWLFSPGSPRALGLRIVGVGTQARTNARSCSTAAMRLLVDRNQPAGKPSRGGQLVGDPSPSAPDRAKPASLRYSYGELMSSYRAHPRLNDRRLQITEVDHSGHPARSLPAAADRHPLTASHTSAWTYISKANSDSSLAPPSPLDSFTSKK